MKLSDYSQLVEACDGMDAVVSEMERAKSAYGLASAVVEFSWDQRKAALARAMASFLKDGDSAAMAEAKARASDGYGAEMKRLRSEYANAEEVRAQYFALKAKFESVRSRASAEKAMAQL